VENISVKGNHKDFVEDTGSECKERVIRIHYIDKAKFSIRDPYSQTKRKAGNNYFNYFKKNNNSEQIIANKRTSAFFCSKKAMKEDKIRRHEELTEDSVSDTIKKTIYNVIFH